MSLRKRLSLPSPLLAYSACLRALRWLGVWCALLIAGPARPAPAESKSPAAQRDRLQEAADLLARAERAFQEDRYAQGVPLAERSLRLREEVLGPDHPAVARSLYTLADLYRVDGQDDGQDAKAKDLHLRALRIRERALGADHPEVADSLFSLAKIYGIREYEKAKSSYLRALQIREKALGPNHPDVVELLNTIAGFYADHGEYKRAEPLFLRALQIGDKALGPDHEFVAKSLLGLANLYDRHGEYKKSEPMYLRALQIRESAPAPSPRYIGVVLNDLAVHYQEQGEYRKAEPIQLRALQIWEKTLGPSHYNVAYALTGLADIYAAQGQHPKAEPLYLRALQIWEKRAADPSAAYALNGLAGVYAAQGQYQRAEPLHLRALHIREKANDANHPEIADSLSNLADVLRDQGEPGKAEPLYRRALHIREKTLGPIHPDVATSLNRLAVLYMASDRPQRAVPLASRALVARELFLRVENTAISEARWEDRNRLQQEEHEARYSLARLLPAAAEVPRLLLTMTLLNKGRSLEEANQLTQAMRQGLTSPERVAQLEKWLALRSQIANVSWHSATGPDYREHLQGLIDQAAALEETLANSSERFRVLRLPRPEQVIDAVAGRMRGGHVLVEYVSYRPHRFAARGAEPRWEDRRYLALLLTPQRAIHLVDLGPADAIHDAVDRLQVRLTAIKDAAAEGQALYRLIMAPLLPYLGGSTELLLSPDDRLNLVPFSALHDGRAYLLERFSFTYLTTGRSLLLPAEQAPVARTAFVFADPDLGAVPPAAPRPSAPAPQQAAVRAVDHGLRRGLLALAPLPGARQEARVLGDLLSARRISAQVLLGERAAKATLLRLQAPTLLHIATHGVFVQEADMAYARGTGQRGLAVMEDLRTRPLPDNPLTRSALVLASARASASSTATDDGLTTALEVAGMNLHGTQLVVLSACDTGRGDVHPVQGVYGLRRAFLIAGTETLVTSLWRVSDEATRELMVTYYTNLLQGRGRVQAMNMAAKDVRRRRPEPYYWAPFIVLGNEAPLRGL